MVDMTNAVIAPSLYQGGNPSGTLPVNYNVSPQAPQQQQGGGLSLQNMPLNFGGKGGGLFNTTAKINQFGTNLGFAPGGLAYTGVGPAALPWAQPGMIANPVMAGSPGVATAQGSLFGGTSLSGALGAAGIGSFAGGFLGKIGGNPTGGSIGGGLGAGIGMAVGGPVGAVIGGLLGGIGGGFFGGKKGTVAANFGADVDENGQLSNISYGAKKGSVDYAKGLTYELNNSISNMIRNFGIKLKPTHISGGYNSLYSPTGKSKPSFITVDKPDGKYTVYGFHPDNEEQKAKAFRDAMMQVATQNGIAADQFNAWYDKGAQAGFKGRAIPTIQEAQPGQPSNWNDFLKNYKTKVGSS